MSSHSNYYLFNNYYQEPVPTYPYHRKSFDRSYIEEHDGADYTFLPPTSSFFDNYYMHPLDATRQSTEATEPENHSPLSGQKGYSPGSITVQTHNPQDYHSKFSNLSVKPINPVASNGNFSTVLGSNTGINFNVYNNNPAPKVPQDKPSLINNTSLILAKKEETEEETRSIKEEGSLDLEEENENEQEQSAVVNSQLKSLLQSQIWSEEKDQLLLKLGSQYKCDWKKISKRFNHKKITPHFLKTRYKELTCAPLQRRIKFSHREDLMIAKYFEKYGSNWTQMATHFHDRTAIMLKNRYYSFIRKRELLDSLIVEVKNIEKDNIQVDGLKDQESETYTNYNMNPQADSQLKDDISPGTELITNSGYASHEKHPIFGYEKTSHHDFIGAVNPPKEVKTSKISESQKEKKEIDFLKARVKSLQSLYMTTKNELKKLKTKN